MQLINKVWTFFTSVKLAIFTLCALALTSIVGTIIPQERPYSFYVSTYGPKTAQFFHILNIPEMYSSWWFLGLLGLLSINLIICSLDRLPAVMQKITADNSNMSTQRMEKMSFCRQWRLPLTHQVPAEVADALRQAGWHIASKKEGENELLFGQKYRWSRMGVYLVHLSILVIFSGAIIGHFLGFKASVMIPEMRSVAQVYGTKDSSPIALGFDLRCDAFTIDFYDNGMPKDYKSKLTILKNDQILLQKEIEVNSPLSYRGITFYQASYEAYRDFIFAVADKATGKSQRFIVPFQEQRNWQEEGVIFGVINAEALGQRVVRSKIWFKSADNPATTIWLADNATTSISSGGKEYDVTVKQMYATGLQVAKDPGVWVVYIGCVLMMMGLFMAFFMAHQRIWLYRQVDASGITIYLSGSTNKNKPAFAKRFERLEALVDQALNR